MVSLRRIARSVALQTLFEVDAARHNAEEVLTRHIEEGSMVEGAAKFARHLVQGVIGNLEKLDKIISTNAPSWPMEQMAKIDKNILRLAIFEILFNNDVPVKAAINEAIELAKSFGSESSSRFVNGVLGTIVTQNSRKNGTQSA
jgi:N utilization substance protein B